MNTEPMKWEERFRRLAIRFLMWLPGPIQLSLSRRKRELVDGDLLHPELHLLVALQDLVGSPRISDLTPQQSRAGMRRARLLHSGTLIRVGSVRDFFISEGDRNLRVRHYAPASSKDGQPRPLLVFYHGGGFVLCDLDTHDTPCRFLCQQANIHVLSVDYRLAPEHPFPAGLEDAMMAFRWASAHASQLGADPLRVMVGGDSAGANLAASISQICKREANGIMPSRQLLIYPAIDRSRSFESLTRFGEGFGLTKRDIDWFEAIYTRGTDPKDSRINLLQSFDLSGLPPALIVTAAFDPLRDEGEEYARALEASGNDCRLLRMPGMIHGFINLIDTSRACRQALAEVASAL